MRTALLALALLAAAGCTRPNPPEAAAPPAAPQPQAVQYAGDPACKLADEDRAWLEGAPAAWSLVQKDIFQIEPLPAQFTWQLFDAACLYTGGDGLHWTASVHNDLIKTPDGEEHPPGVVSFSASSPQGSFMLMSLPSVWRAANVNDRGGMAPFLYSVFVHEMTHLRQTGEIYDRITKIGDAAKVGDTMSDDIVQNRFKDDAAFKASVEKERDILLAGFAGDDAAARASAKEALGLIKARQAKWYTGDDAYMAELEDLFLTLEGAGQFAGYSWLVHPKGAARAPADAVASMRTKWWSQEEGMAIMLVVSHLVPDWRTRVFSDHPQTALELLALAAGQR